MLRRSFAQEHSLWIDLLDPDQEERYALRPAILKEEVRALNSDTTHIIIDEIQKVPKLLDVVHQLIESTDKTFVMTGSSARKLKYGGANLLAGRAFVYNLYPFTAREIGDTFDLIQAMTWGTLPSILYTMKSEADKANFLRAYTRSYLKEEIWLEQFIRKMPPFRKFLEVAAQCNGQIINIAKIARDVGVDDKTIQQYFSILEDTLIGFMLEPYVTSFRKRLSLKPKFYFFDIGVCRSLSGMLTIPVREQSKDYGYLFEHFIVLECLRLANYFHPDYKFSYLHTKDGVEVDLVVERPGQKTLWIEIKSSDHVGSDKINAFSRLVTDAENSEGIVISRDAAARKINNVTIFPWQQALDIYFSKR